MCQFLKANKNSNQVVPIHVIDQLIKQGADNQRQNNMNSNAQKLDRPNPATMKLSNYTGPYRQNESNLKNSFDVENALYADDTYNTLKANNQFMEEGKQKELDDICAKYGGDNDEQAIKENKQQNVTKVATKNGDVSLAKLEGVNTNSYKRPLKNYGDEDIFEALGGLADEPKNHKKMHR